MTEFIIRDDSGMLVEACPRRMDLSNICGGSNLNILPGNELICFRDDCEYVPRLLAKAALQASQTAEGKPQEVPFAPKRPRGSGL